MPHKNNKSVNDKNEKAAQQPAGEPVTLQRQEYDALKAKLRDVLSEIREIKGSIDSSIVRELEKRVALQVTPVFNRPVLEGGSHGEGQDQPPAPPSPGMKLLAATLAW
jgi:hypothetical protein